MKSTLSLRFSIKRLVLLTLVSLVAVAALLGIAASANKANRAAKARDAQAAASKSAIIKNTIEQQPNAPAAAVIVATLTDNVTAATKIAPGANINYTATITNNGAVVGADDATNLNFSDTLDANTTLVPGSIHASPIAFNDTYNWVGNTQLDTAARSLAAVTLNDVAVNAPAGIDTFTVTAIAGGATTLGGTVTLASPSGAFTYTPPLGRPNIGDGASVSDTFTYTITNNADASLTSTGTVTINLTGRVWYLQAGAAGDGRSNTPSGSPAAMSTAADKGTDFFYIFSGGGSLNGPFSVDAGQQLLGQGVNLVVSAITLFTATSNPTTTNTAGNCVALAGAPGNNTLSGFDIGNCTGGTAISGANVGTLNVSTMSINTNGAGLDLTGVGLPTVSVVLGGLTSTSGARNVNLVGMNGTFTLASGALSGATGNALHVDNGNGGLTYSGTISNSGGRQVNIINKTGGTVALSGAIGGTGTGIFLNANNGATMNFTGGITLSTGANAAFTATGPGPAATSGGTVNVTQNNTTIVNTLTTSTGTALNVAHTTIGASGITFRSISATSSPNGILLNNTGATAGLTVSANGGTCTSAGTCTGGAIQTTTGDGVSLTSTRSVSLTNMFVSNTGGSGILGTTVNGLTVAGSRFEGAGDAAAEHGIFITNLLGTSSVSGSTFIDNSESHLKIRNTTSTVAAPAATQDILTLSNSTFSFSGGAFVGDNIQYATETTANARFIVTGPVGISGAVGTAGVQCNASSGSRLDVQISGVTRTGGNGTGINMNPVGPNTFLTYHINGNNISNTNTIPINATVIAGGATTANPARTEGTIDNNVVSNSPNASGIVVIAEGNAQVNSVIGTVAITNNNISGIANGQGIRAQARVGGTLNLTITNNLSNINNALNLEGIHIENGSSAVGDNINNICLNMGGSTLALGNKSTVGALSGQEDYRLTARNPTTASNNFQLQNFVGVGTSAVDVTTWVTTTKNNRKADGVTIPTVQASFLTSGAFSTSAGCATSTFRPEPLASNSLKADDPFVRANSLNANATALSSAATVAQNSSAPTIARVSTKDGIASVLAKATPKASAAEVARIYRSERPLSHHAVFRNKNVFSQDPNAPTSGENVTLNTIATFPAGGKSITIKYSATVNQTALTARQATTQGTVTANAGAISVLTDDPEPGGGADPTVTLLNTTITWTGNTSTDWNTATNWTTPGPLVAQYAPGVTNPAVNDVIIPAVATQPTIGAALPSITIYSLDIATGMTLTILSPNPLTVGGAPGGNLVLNGIISGGEFRMGTGTHSISGTGSLSSTNLMRVISGSIVTLSNDLQAGALAVDGSGSMTIASRILSLNGSGVALAVAGGATFTTTGSTVVFNGTAAQQAAGIAYNNLTINNTIGLNVTGVTLTGNASVGGTLTLTSSDLDTSTFTLTQPNTTASTGVSDVVGTVIRSGGPFPLGPLTFGNPNNIITFTGVGTRPTTMTVVMAKVPPASYTSAVQRNYTISQTVGTGFTATVRLHYLDSELGTNTPETSLGLRRLRTGDGHWVAAPPPPGTPTRDGTANWVEAAGVTAADLVTQWTFAVLTPTASDGIVTGRIVDGNGTPVEGAVVRMEGTQSRKFITDANGFYRFENVEAGGFYTVTPSRANYSFSPSVRSFSLIGETTQASFGATLTSGAFVNPLDTPEYFVRQHYIDFLNREPDEAGFNFWSDQIIECGGDTNCTERRRENVSAAYFLSIEFQETGGLVDGLYRSAYGVRPNFSEFMPDTRTVASGVVVGREGWQARLEENKRAFVAAFAQRPAFINAYGNMDHSLFVDTLINHTGVSFTAAERDALVSGLSTGNMTRAEALRSIAENNRFVSAKFNETFVMMEYFGYLRRDADASGFAFWLNKLNEFGGNFERAEMVKAFIVSGEFRDRFPR